MSSRTVAPTASRRSNFRRPLGAAAVVGVALSALVSPTASAIDPPDATVFVSEIHYDNAGTDVGEAIEIFGPAGTALDDWSVVLYNGSNGTEYSTTDLSGSIPDLADGLGVVTIDFPSNGIQNGSPDGIALVDATGSVAQFISYEGSLTAADGPASGQTSTDIGVSEPGTTAIGDSLQLVGSGPTRSGYTWADPQPSTFGALNGEGGGDPGGGPVDGVGVTEFHYDNDGGDVGEAIEISGPAGTDLEGWLIEAYNGNGGTVYNSQVLTGVIPDEDAGLGALSFAFSGLQNGAPDGFALSAPDGTVVDFLSYEGTLTGVGGAADGLDSTDVGVAETSSTPVGESLQLIDGVWTGPAVNSFGMLNGGGVIEPPVGSCEDAPAVTLISEIQGAGAESPCVDEVVVIEGIVVGDFQDGDAGVNGDLNGFFVQEEDADADADPLTSEGIYVFNGSDPLVDVAIGDLVRVEGEVSEFFDMTQIESFTGVTVVSSGNPAPTAAVGVLPVTSVDDFEAFEGMSVTFPQDLVISEYFNFDRFGEIVLTSQRNLTPTAEVEPGPDAIAEAENYLLDRITLDDGRSSQNPDPAIHPNGSEFDLTNLFRGGDTVGNVTGVLNYSFDLYRVQPTQGADYTSANPRTAAPDPVGGRLQVATFNVLNYFTTLDDAGPICGPAGDQDCRGADDATELTRQRDKIISAITAIDADVVGLIEIENNATDGPTADLVAGLNDVAGAGTYDYVVTGAIGTDAIRVAIVYKPASVTPSGAFAVLDSSVDPRFDDTKSRPVLAQTFVENATGSAFTVAVNHFKSKGSSCDDIGDPNDGQGGGNCNGTRTLAAEALVDWLATDPTGSGDADVLIVGDLNSYDKEDPIDALLAGGYSDLILDSLGESAYSYVFDGQFGYLDYQLASASMTPQVTGTTVWHINADEPDAIDYDTSFKQDAQDAIYAPDAFRSSDHDPVIVGLDLDVAAPATARDLKEMARDDLAAALPTGSWWSDFVIDRAIIAIDRSLQSSYWLDDSALDPKLGWRVFVNEAVAVSWLSAVHGSAQDDAQAAIDKLIAADDLLANDALSIAIATGGDERDIDRAETELERAAEDIERERFDRAIIHYLQAWSWSIRAIDDARFATYNASLNRSNAGDLIREVSIPGSAQPAAIAEVIQRNRPEVVLVNEFDYDEGGIAAARFQQNYLSVSQNGADPIEYPYRYTAPSNTGVDSGVDLDNSGSVGGPGDAFGFGFFPGQFGMVVYSMHPIDVGEVRTFQNFLWKDMPGALLPDDPATAEPADWYSSDELDVFRLSSKSHWDVPIWVGDRKVHFLVSHPTPPVFDGPEDRNGTRNFDEIRFWADYVAGGHTASYIYDDAGSFGGLSRNDRFVIAGDQNSDPFDGDSIPGAIQQLLDSPKVNTSVTPSSSGGTEQAALQGGANASHLSDPAFDTADFSDSSPGNLRADYVLPSRTLRITAAGVFWPSSGDPLFSLVGNFPFPSSDHRLVWVDVVV